jgi:hypothetical protein
VVGHGGLLEERMRLFSSGFTLWENFLGVNKKSQRGFLGLKLGEN